MSRLTTAVMLARGDFVRFLEPAWGDAERDAVRAWLAGESFPDATSELEASIDTSIGGDVRSIAVSSGRAAIEMALRSLHLPPRSEVAIPSFSCSALGAAVLQAGLDPLLVDVDDQLNIDVESLDAAWSPSTRAVIVPHLGGVFAGGTNAIVDMASDRGAVVIEDGAHALGLRVGGRLTGGWAPATVFSTGIGKPLFGPGGGLLVLQSDGPVPTAMPPEEPRRAVEERVRAFLRTMFPSSRERIARLTGAARATMAGPVQGMHRFAFTAHTISDIEARLATLQLKGLAEVISIRRHNAARWRSLLADLPYVVAPEANNTATKVWVQGADAELAGRLRSMLWAEGVECESLYTPLHHRAPFTTCRRSRVPRTDSLSQRVFSLPARPNLTDCDWQRAERAIGRLKSALS